MTSPGRARTSAPSRRSSSRSTRTRLSASRSPRPCSTHWGAPFTSRLRLVVQTSRPLLVTSLGTLPYAEALDLQRAVARARIDGSLPTDVLLLVEHPPVITSGRSTKAAHVLLDR